MNATINTRTFFYDYFPHLPVMLMKTLFDLDYHAQIVIRDEIQQVIAKAYDRLTEIHDLNHANIYREIGDGFDANFYQELKASVQLRLHDALFWAFLDKLMPKTELADEAENRNLRTKMTAIVGFGPPIALSTNRINLKDALVALLNYDLEPLSGQELLHLTKIK